MSDTFSNYVASHIGFVLVLALVAFCASFVYWSSKSGSLAWTDFTVRFWKLRRWQGHTEGIEKREHWASDGLPDPEKALCDTYIDLIKSTSRTEFNNAREYLVLTHQGGRLPMSFWSRIMLYALTVAEAGGTGLLIAPYVAAHMTGKEMVWVGYVVALALAVGLLKASHTSGVHLYKYYSIKKNLGSSVASEDGFQKAVISPEKDQWSDAHESLKVRYANRVFQGGHDRGSPAWAVFTAIAMIALLGVVTYMRIQGIDQSLTNTVLETGQTSTVSVGASNTDPFPNNSQSNTPGASDSAQMPPDIQNQTAQTNAQAAAESTSEKRREGYAGAVVLAIVYLFTQAIGFNQSFKHAFINHGEDAYNKTRGEATFDSYESKFVRPVLSRAQLRLTILRNGLARRVQGYRANQSKMTVDEYYTIKIRKNLAESKTRELPAETVQIPPTPTVQADPSPTVKHRDQVQSLTQDDILQIAQQMLAAPTVEEKNRILHSRESTKDEKLAIIAKAKEQKSLADQDFLSQLEDL